MANYIELERARFEAKRYFKNLDTIQEDLDMLFCMLSTSDVAPVRHGRWVNTEPEYNYERHCSAHYQCSECGRRTGRNQTRTYKYCPNCGAKMDLEVYE